MCSVQSGNKPATPDIHQVFAYEQPKPWKVKFKTKLVWIGSIYSPWLNINQLLNENEDIIQHAEITDLEYNITNLLHKGWKSVPSLT